ncbi:MAG: cysteine desulfurase [Deltaproteobacteria bacterium]|nr:cysteine desulfurase [Deltaproteobacteria bacterium]
MTTPEWTSNGAPSSPPTPGLSPSVVKHPAAPTMPDPEPTTIAQQIMQLASGNGTPSPPLVPQPPISTLPSSSLASPSLAVAPAAASPFFMPLQFSVLPDLSAIFGTMSFPLVDAPQAQAQPQTPNAPDIRTDSLTLDPALPKSSQPRGAFDPHFVRAEFPILKERVNGREIVWLDNAATTQKPQTVLDRLSHFYAHENSNVHRAAHTLAARATTAYENARAIVAGFLNARSSRDIVFVRGATEGINLVAKSWGARHVGEGDEIVITHLEHHANIVPWQMLCNDKKAKLRVAPVDDRGQIILDEYEKLLGPRTKLVSFSQVSNALGTITPAKAMVDMAHRHGAKVLVDGAQAVSHMPVDVQGLDCDFYAFSGHKVFAPTGIGVVFGKSELLDGTPPWQGGGNMIQDVTFERTTYQPAPARFEAGTGNIADAVGLGAALEWLSALGLQNVERYEHELLEYATGKLLSVPGLHIIGTAAEKAGVISFILDGQKTEELSGLLDREGIAVRSGHHCAQPILRRFGVEATVRASLAPYNTVDDVDALCAALHRLQAGRPVR